MSDDDLVTITFIVLSHDSADRTLDLVTQLLEEDPTCRVLVHWDKKSSRAMFQQLAHRLDSEPRCHLMRNRVRCGWGQWGLVEAPLRALKYALAQPTVTDYFYLVSEYCRPIRPLIELREFLTEHDGTDFIECEGPEWIQGGIREDRYLYRHYLDKRQHPNLHRWMYRVQKSLRLKRKPPSNIEIKFGSQWWCLCGVTVKRVFENRCLKCLTEFFEKCWIPDESFFQTLVFSEKQATVSGKVLTYFEFDASGAPCFFDYSLNFPLDCFFARKFK